MMELSREEKRLQEIVEFRYGIVAELANPYLQRGKLQEMIDEKAALSYDIPYSTKHTLSASCIKEWLRKYKQFGKAGLRPKERSDKGKSRLMPEAEVAVLREYLISHPQVTAIAGYKKLYREGHITTVISPSSLSRLVIAEGIREERSESGHRGDTRVLKFSFRYPLECIQADCMHGPQIPYREGKRKKAILILFLDDATRRVVYSRFTFSEHSLEFEAGLKHVLKAYGRIYRVYVDHGSTFVSQQTQRILDILKIQLIHSRVGVPRGRGKVERMFRTVRDGFLRPLDLETIQSLEDLNMRFATWVETEYHRSPHRGLAASITPLEAWLKKVRYLHPTDPTIDLDRVFFHETTRRVYNDATITIANTLYEVPPVLIGKQVRLTYNPHQPVPQLYVSQNGISYGEARLVDSYANTRVKRDITKTAAVEGETHTSTSHISAGLAASRLQAPRGGTP